MNIVEFKEKANKTVSVFKDKLKLVRTGRASPALVEDIRVDAYGSPTPLNQLGSVSVLDPYTIGIVIWDKSVLDAVVSAISKSDLGINPAVEATLIRLKFPTMTEDRRKEITKIVGKYEEEAKVAIRAIRTTFLQNLKKRKDEEKLPEDLVKNEESSLDKEVKYFQQVIEDIASDKKKDIMTL